MPPVLETGVALADALVVFSNGEHAVATAAVGEDEYGALYAGEEFLDNHSRTRRAEHAAEHLLKRCFGLIDIVDYEHALPAASPSALEHVWCLEEFRERHIRPREYRR